MRHLCKAQCIGDFGHIPPAVLQQDFCFLQNPFGDDLGGGFFCDGFDRPVQMIDVNVQLLRKFGGRAEVHFRVAFIKWKLALQQFQENCGNALRSIDRLFVGLGGRLHLHGKMQELKNKVSQYIVLVDIVGFDFIKYFLINNAHLLNLLIRQLKHMISGWLKYRILI